MSQAQDLSDGLARLGLTISAESQEKLLAYLALLGKWNKVYNLTAIREPRQMVRHHLLDSLAVIRPLRRQLGLPEGDTSTLEGTSP